jgi:hypothetical protein
MPRPGEPRRSEAQNHPKEPPTDAKSLIGRNDLDVLQNVKIMSRPKASRIQKSGHFLRDHAKRWWGKRQNHEKMPNKRRPNCSRLSTHDHTVNNLLKTSRRDETSSPFQARVRNDGRNSLPRS